MVDRILLQTKNLKKSYGKTKVLHGIDITIVEGERVAIIGKNGGGKSTLINTILGLLPIDSGKILYPYHNNVREDFLDDLGIQFQDSTYPTGYTVDEIIDLVHDINFDGNNIEYKNFIKKTREPIKEELLKVFNLIDYRKKKTKKLSGGQKQRLNILLALVKKPKMLILDEITTGLDIEAKHTLIRYIDYFAKKHKITLVIVSHIVAEMLILSNRLILIEDGRVIHQITMKEIIEKYQSLENYVNSYFIDGKIPKGGKK